MKKSFSLILISFVLIVPITSLVVYAAAPPLPARFYGAVQVSGADVSPGALVSAWIDGIKIAETRVFVADGDLVFRLDVPGDDPATAPREGGSEGQAIVFQIAGWAAGQTGVWRSGAYNRLDLTAAAIIPDLTISKDDGRTTVLPGEILTYTLAISVTGSQGANSVVVTDTLPKHTTFLAASDGGSEAGGVVTWPAFGLAGGASTTRTVAIQVDDLLPVALDVLTNTVVVAEAGSAGLDPRPENNTDLDINTVSDSGPVVEAGPDQTVAEGDTVNLAGANFFDLGPLTTHSAIVDWGDGAVEAGAINESGQAGTISAAHVYGDDGAFTVEICVADDRTGATGCDSLQVVVANVAPVMALVDLQRWTAESYPPLPNFPAGEWLVAPDGQSVLQVQNGQPTFFYSDFEVSHTQIEGHIQVQTNEDDDFIGFALGFQPGDATNPKAEYLLVDWKRGSQDISLGCKVGTHGPRGLAISRVFGIPDSSEFWGHTNFDGPACPDLNHGLAELARAITLGDTGWQRFTDYKFTFQYSPTRLKVFVNDVLELDITGKFPAGRLAFLNFSQAQVSYSAFELTELNVVEGAIMPLTHAFADAGILDTHTATIDWGDNSAVEAGNVAEVDGAGSVSGNHVYVENGQYSAQVCVSDDDGGTDCDTIEVNVHNAPPAAEAGPDQTGYAGRPISLTSAGFTDPGNLDTHTATLDWGDGSPAETGIVSESSGTGAISGAHTYPVTGTYTVQVCVTDDDGGSGCDTFAAHILTSLPDLAISLDNGQTTVRPGQILTYTLTISNIGQRDATGVLLADTLPLSATLINVSDGGVETAAGLVTWPTFNLAVGETVTRTLALQLAHLWLPGITTITNTAAITDDGANGIDPVAGNNIDWDIDEGSLPSPYGSITIIKQAEPNSSQTFQFETTISGHKSFTLLDDGSNAANSITFSDLPTGLYTITETYIPRWALLDIACQLIASALAPDTNVITATHMLMGTSINLTGGQDVVCTFTNSQPSAVTLSPIQAIAHPGQIEIFWSTFSETDVAGFNVLRGTSDTGSFSQVNQTLLPARGDALTGADYRFIDVVPVGGETYYYYLQEVLRSGGAVDHQAMTVAVSIDNHVLYLPLVQGR